MGDHPRRRRDLAERALRALSAAELAAKLVGPVAPVPPQPATPARGSQSIAQQVERDSLAGSVERLAESREMELERQRAAAMKTADHLREQVPGIARPADEKQPTRRRS